MECLCEQGDQIPIFKGCSNEVCDDSIYKCAEGAFLDKIYENLSYPIEARQDTIEGMVVVKFLVSEEGELSNFKTTNEPLGYGLEEAALVAARSLKNPGFYPAYKNCQAVEFEYVFPVRFKMGI